MAIDRAVQHALDGGHLPPPTDQIRLSTPDTRDAVRAMPNSRRAGHRLIGTLDLNQLRLAESRCAINQSRGRRAEHHPTRRSDRLHPLRHPHLLTDSGVTQRARTDFTGDHLTGVEPYAQPQFDAVAVVDLDGKPLRLLLNAQGRKTGTHRVVLQRHRRAEHRHDAVAGELVHRAAVPLHHRRRSGRRVRP